MTSIKSTQPPLQKPQAPQNNQTDNTAKRTIKAVSKPIRHITSARQQPLTVRICKHASFSLLPTLVLLVLRQLVPEVAEALPGVYGFLDGVILPIVNWAYAVVSNGVEWLMSLGWFKAIIEWLAKLGA